MAQNLFGITDLDQMEILNQRIKERQARSMQAASQVGRGSPADQTGATIGGLFGNWLGDKFNPPKLNPAEQAARDLNTRIGQRYTERLNQAQSKAGALLSEEDKALEMQMAAADAHFEQGNYDQYNALVLDASQKRRARVQAEAQQKILDNAVSNIENENTVLTAQASSAKSGESMPIIGIDEDPLVATPRIGRLMPDQSVEVHNEDGSVEIVKQYMPLDQALAITRARQQAEEDGDGGRVKVNQLWSAQQREALAAAPLAQLEQAHVLNGMAEVLTDIVDQGGDPDLLTQTAGGALSFVDKIRSTSKALGGYATEFLDGSGGVVFKGDLSSDSQRRALRARSPEVNAAYERIKVPPALKSEAERQAWRSAVFQLAWTTWRSSEGSGARQASNQDFAIALDELGANAGSVRAMIATSVRRLSSGSEKYSNLVAQARAQGRYGGWTQEQVDGQIFGNQAQRASEEMTKALTRLEGFIREPEPTEVNQESLDTMAVPEGWDPADWAFLTPDEQRQVLAE